MDKATKKSYSRVLILAASVLMIIVMALAVYATDYDLWVDGERVTSDNASDILGNGTAVYSASENVLYLDGATLSEVALWRGTDQDPEWEQYRAAIGSKIPGLTINLSGDNTIYVDGSYYDGIDTDYNCDLTITGTGTLSIQTPGGYGMYISGWDFVETTGDLTVTGGATVIVDSGLSGIWVQGNIFFDNCTIRVTKDEHSYLGVVCNTGKITMTDSDVRLETIGTSILLGNGEVHDYELILNSGTLAVTVTGDGADDIAVGYAIDTTDPANISKARMTVNGGTFTINSVSGGTLIPEENITIADGLAFSEGTSLRDAGRVVLGPAEEDVPDHIDLSISDPAFQTKINAAMKKAVKNRMTEFTVTITGPYNDVLPVAQNWPAGADTEIWKAVFEHTGVPDEGDYLAFQFNGYHMGLSASGTYDEFTATITYEIGYYTTLEQEKAVTARVASVLRSLDLEGKPDYVKVREIYNWICTNVVYDNENKNNAEYKLKYSAYAALINGTAVCQGYANLFYRMALEAGVDARIISGQGYGGSSWEGHAWNIVKLGDLYYNLDSTWDTTVYNSQGRYDFFLRGNGTNYFTQRHVRQQFKLTDYYYYDTTSDEFNARHPMDQNDYVVKYSIGVSTDDEENGTVEITGHGTEYEYGESSLGNTVVIKATPKEGYAFKEWKLNGETYSTNPQVTIVLGEAELDLEAVFEERQVTYTTGDIDGDGSVDIEDVVLFLQNIMFPDLYPVTYAGAMDFNHDGTVNISDVVLLLQHTVFPSMYPLD